MRQSAFAPAVAATAPLTTTHAAGARADLVAMAGNAPDKLAATGPPRLVIVRAAVLVPRP